MNRQIRAVGWRLAARIAPTVMASVGDLPTLRERVDRLSRGLDQATRRICALEEEVQEARRLNRRLAEITDLVEEVLLPAADRDDDRLRRALDKYAEVLGRLDR